MSNPSFSDGRIKIGKSHSDPSSFRKKELYSTGVPEPFVVEYYAFVEDYNNAEIEIHRTLSKVRPNKDREFFNISPPEAIIKIRELCEIKYEEVFYRSPEEIENFQKIKDKETYYKNLSEDDIFFKKEKTKQYEEVMRNQKILEFRNEIETLPTTKTNKIFIKKRLFFAFLIIVFCLFIFIGWYDFWSDIWFEITLFFELFFLF